MNFWSLTLEKVEKLKAERDAKEDELNTLLGKSPTDLCMYNTLSLHSFVNRLVSICLIRLYYAQS